MANHVFRELRERYARGLIDLQTADWRALLVGVDSTVLGDKGVEFISQIATLDETDAAGYARQVLAGVAVTIDATNDLVKVDATDPTFGALGYATKPIKGMLLYIHAGADSANRVGVWIDTVSSGVRFPYTTTGATVSVVFDAGGFLNL